MIIDQYSKYPEVDIVKSTSFTKLEPCLDRILASHGIPETLSTDNGSPYFSHEMSEYAKLHGIKHTPVTPEDPQCNGFAENFVKLLCKFVHTTIVEGKDPKKELQKYLIYRATPHSSTNKSPAELLNGHKIKTKLLQLYHLSHESKDQDEIRQKHDSTKLKQKQYFDRRAKEKTIKVGDNILVKQRKSTTQPPYDPSPYKVTKVKGNQISADRHGKRRIRDKNQIKLLPSRPITLTPSWEHGINVKTTNYNDFDIEGKMNLSCNIGTDSNEHKGISSSTPTSANEQPPPTDPNSQIEISNLPDVPPTHMDTSTDSNKQRETGNNLQSSASPTTDPSVDDLFTINEEEEKQMEEILRKTFQQSTTPSRILRSSNVSLKWNSRMNDGPTVLESKSDEHLHKK